MAKHLNRRYIAVAGKTPEAGQIDADSGAKTASLVTPQGVEENVKIVQQVSSEPMPWRFSVDIPRALIFLCIIGVSNLLYVPLSFPLSSLPLSTQFWLTQVAHQDAGCDDNECGIFLFCAGWRVFGRVGGRPICPME